MATEYNQVLTTDLDVVPIYKELMQASTGQGSVYIKAKETLVDIYNNSSLSDEVKSTVISQTISSIATSITQQAMTTALAVVKENRDAPYTLTKLKEDTRYTTAQIVKMEADIANAETDNDLKVMSGWKAQAELYRDFGAHTWDYAAMPVLLPETAYTTYGTKVESIKMAQANVYNGYATAYRQNGTVLPVIDSSTGWLTTGTAGDTNGLSYWQTKVAERQEQGFDDNTRQHVANSSATMISMLLSSEEEYLVDDASRALAKWETAVDYLNRSIGKPSGSILISSSGELSKTIDMAISGSTIAILPGTTVVISLSKVSGAETSPATIDDGMVALVQLDGTWSTSIGSGLLSATTIGDVYTVEARVIDQAGAARTNSVSKTIIA